MATARRKGVRATGVSDPLGEHFRMTYPDVDIDHCDSLQYLHLHQDVLDILPREGLLDPRGRELHTLFVKLTDSNNGMSAIWLESEDVARRMLRWPRRAALRHPASDIAANQLAECCAVFCKKLSDTNNSYTSSDKYVITSLCHQVTAVKCRCCSFTWSKLY